MTVLRTLLEVTIYSGVLFLAILLFRTVFKKRTSPAMMYAAWLLLAVRLIIPFTIGGISLIVLPAQESAVQIQQSSVSPQVEDTVGEASISPQMPAVITEELADVEPAAVQAGVQTEETAAVTSAVSWELDWGAALIVLWIAGAVIVLLNVAITTAKLYKRIASAPRLPDEWYQAALLIQKEMGIRSRVRFVAMQNFASPALSASFRPTIVIPIELLSQSGQGIEFALRHELTHVKRKDHLVCLLLTLLKAIYWFNPVIWIAARLMRMDMETACDSRVVSAMDGKEKKQYATTVLGMCAQTQPQFVLGMALGHTRQAAERRIRGIYMRKRSSRGAKAAALLLAAVMLIACFTTACQPVTQTDGGSINTEPPEQAETTPAPEDLFSEPTPTPEPTVNPNLTALQQKSQLISGNITANTLTFALRKDGTVVQAGDTKDYGTFEISEWRKITAISSGYQHLIGLRSNGTVVVTGATGAAGTYMNEAVKEWKNIKAVTAGGNATVMGLKSDGTVVAINISYDSSDPNKVKNWSGIVAIAAGENFGAGLRSDGTVVATGINEHGQCNVGEWKDIVAIAASEKNLIGLKSDGTVVATGYNNDGRCDVQEWRNIIAVASGGFCTFGLTADGTVVSVGDNYLGQGNTQKWKDIIAISAGAGYTVGLKADGTMVSVGVNNYGRCEVENWTDLAVDILK